MISVPARAAKSYFSTSKQGRRIFNRALLQAGADGGSKRPPKRSNKGLGRISQERNEKRGGPASKGNRKRGAVTKLEKTGRPAQPNPEGGRLDFFDEEIVNVEGLPEEDAKLLRKAQKPKAGPPKEQTDTEEDLTETEEDLTDTEPEEDDLPSADQAKAATAGEVYFLQAFELHARQNENMKDLIHEIQSMCEGNPYCKDIQDLIDKRAIIFAAQTKHADKLREKVNLALESHRDYSTILNELCSKEDRT